MGKRFKTRAKLILLLILSATFSAQFAPLTDAQTGVPPVGAIIVKIETSLGKVVPFTLSGAPRLEIVNNRLNIAVNSREGMVFELTGIPAKEGFAARKYRPSEFRALLLHSPFQEEAASDDASEDASTLQIRKAGDGEAASVTSAEIQYSGKLRAGSEILSVQFEFSGSLPMKRRFLAPTPQAQPSASP